MIDRQQFGYYFGDESEQFTFIKVPKMLFQDKIFIDLSYGAVFLYGILLDRMQLSKKNNWLDEFNRVYIVYTIEAIMADFSVSKTKAIAFLNELEKIGLIEKKRRPNKPAMIYVKNFITEANRKRMEVQNLEVQKMDFQKEGEIQEIQGSPENGLPDSGLPEVQKLDPNKTDISKTNNILSSSSSGYENEDDDNLNQTTELAVKDIKKLRELYMISRNRWSQAQNKEYLNQIRAEFLKQFHQNLDYESLLSSHDKKIVDKIINNVMTEDCIRWFKGGNNIQVGKKLIGMEMLINIYLEVNNKQFGDILFNAFENNSKKIVDAESYIRACIYNAAMYPFLYSQHKEQESRAYKSRFSDMIENEYNFEQLEAELLHMGGE